MKFPFNLAYLKFFYDAARHQSISESARENYVTQSAISQGIMKLEASLGFALTMHLRNQFKLTDEGRIVFEEATIIFKGIKLLEDRLHECKCEIVGTVQFACTPTLATIFIFDLLKIVKKQHPKISLKFKVGSIQEIQSWLKSEVVDFAIVLESDEFTNYQNVYLAEGRFQLYQHRNLKENSLSKGILVDNPRGIYVKELLRNLPEVIIQQALSSWDLTAHFADRKMGVGFLPDFIPRSCHPHLVPIETPIPDFMYRIIAIYPKTIAMTHAIKSVLGLLNKCDFLRANKD